MNISPTDEREIIWFLSFGISAFDRSTMGPMLDRADRYGHRLVGVDSESGKVSFARVKQRVLPDPRRRPAGHASEPWDANPITAFPTAEHRGSGGWTPHDGTLMLFAKIGRRLEHMAERSPNAVRAIEAYYGDRGAAFDSAGQSRVCAVFRFTEPGRKLLAELAREAHKAGNQQDLSDDKRLENEMAADRKRRGGHPRSYLINLADRDARALLDEATRLWQIVVRASDAAGGAVERTP